MSVSLDLRFRAIVNVFLSFPKPLIKPLEDYIIQGRRLNSILDLLYLKNFTWSLQSHPWWVALYIRK